MQYNRYEMRFGFHISIAGGFGRVTDRAEKKGCETLQLFSRNPRGWHCPPLNDIDVAKFREDIKQAGISPVFVHLPYLPNLASPKDDLLSTSISSLEEELHRAEILGADFVIAHMGKRIDSPLQDAIERMAFSINTALGNVKNDTILLLENTAGQGSEIGDKFSVIGYVIDRIVEKSRLGVCLDTAHAFEAGYDISKKDGIDHILKEIQNIIGLERLYLLHLNDSKTPLGSHIDRHWHIGEGYIGLSGFETIINHPLLCHLPSIMETPRKADEDDTGNMEVIRRLVKK